MLSKRTLLELKEYIEEQLLPSTLMNDALYEEQEILEHKAPLELENYITTHAKPPFNEVLFQMIDQKGFTGIEVYKKAQIDRKHFSKIRSNPAYRIGKKTAVSLVLALKLTREEADQLLSSAGFSLSESDPFDLVIQFCLERKIYDLDEVNEALESVSVKNEL